MTPRPLRVPCVSPPCPPPGQFCTEDVDECQLQPNACHNGGTCFNTRGGHTCVCVNGWTGESCSENIDDCATAVCLNGATCHDRVASFYCACPMGKTGEEEEGRGGHPWGGQPLTPVWGGHHQRGFWCGVRTSKSTLGWGGRPGVRWASWCEMGTHKWTLAWGRDL